MENNGWHNQIINHDVSKPFPLLDECIDVVITSPPYWGLRDYGVKSIFGGDPNCKHIFSEYNAKLVHENRQNLDGGTIGNAEFREKLHGFGNAKAGFCQKCGAWYGQLGLEPHPQMFIDHLVLICREIKRVLKKSGSFYLNLGDTYFGGGQGGGNKNAWKGKSKKYGHIKIKPDNNWLQPKQLLGIPERVMIALQNDGWVLRNKNVWHKINSMPSSAKDRLNSTWEPVFHFVKSLPRTTWLLDVPYNEKGKWMWLAALVDGEGCIGISRSKHEDKHDVFSVYLSIGNTSKKLLEECVSITGFGKIEKTKGTNLKAYIWRINNRYASTVIAEIYPYLIAKEEQARICFELQKTNKHRGNNKGENRGPKPISEKEWNRKLELYELCKKAKRETLNFLKEPDLRRTIGCARYYYDLDAIREPHKDSSLERAKYGFNVIPRAWEQEVIPVSGGKKVNIDCHSAGKNPGDILEYDSKYKDAEYGQTAQGFTRSHSKEKERIKSREDAKKLFPNDLKKQQEYINYIHDHGGHPMGPNPGDVIDYDLSKECGLPTTGSKARSNLPSQDQHRDDNPIDDNPKGKNPGDVIQFDEEYWWNFILGRAHSNRFYKKAYELMRNWMIKNNCFDYAIFYEWYRGEFEGKWASGTLERGKADYLSDEKRLPFPKPETRFLGDVPGDFWEICTSPFTGYNPDLEHFAVFPPELVLKPLKSSCPKEICKKCGKPKRKVVETGGTKEAFNIRVRDVKENRIKHTDRIASEKEVENYDEQKYVSKIKKYVIAAGCNCNAGFDAGIVLDPFCGRGTVGKVARDLGLNYVLFDIKPEYCELARLYVGGQKRKLIKYQQKLGYGET